MNERESQIINAAGALFLEEGVGVSTAKIAKAAGVSNGTLFNYFPTKQALIDAIYKAHKTSLFEKSRAHVEGEFSLDAMKRNWDAYLAWSRENPQARLVMNLLYEAGLASDEAKAEMDALYAPYALWLASAYDDGHVQAPNAEFVPHLIFAYFDLVLTLDLRGDDEVQAFEMLCQSLGVK